MENNVSGGGSANFPRVAFRRGAAKIGSKAMQTLYLAAAMGVGIASLTASRALAATVISSRAVRPGAGGISCACSARGGYIPPDDLNLTMSRGNGLLWGSLYNCSIGDHRTCTLNNPSYTADAVVCEVFFGYPKQISGKNIRCTLSPIDSSGNPITVVPFD